MRKKGLICQAREIEYQPIDINQLWPKMAFLCFRFDQIFEDGADAVDLIVDDTQIVLRRILLGEFQAQDFGVVLHGSQRIVGFVHRTPQLAEGYVHAFLIANRRRGQSAPRRIKRRPAYVTSVASSLICGLSRDS